MPLGPPRSLARSLFLSLTIHTIHKLELFALRGKIKWGIDFSTLTTENFV